MPVKNAFAVPIPEEKQKFLGQLNYPKESRAEFLVTQAGYIRKRFWILSFIINNYDNYCLKAVPGNIRSSRNYLGGLKSCLNCTDIYFMHDYLWL